MSRLIYRDIFLLLLYLEKIIMILVQLKLMQRNLARFDHFIPGKKTV
jgi:hypothetical protein